MTDVDFFSDPSFKRKLDEMSDQEFEPILDSLVPLRMKIEDLTLIQVGLKTPGDDFELVATLSARQPRADGVGYLEVEQPYLWSTSKNMIVMDQMVQITKHLGSHWQGTLIVVRLQNLVAGPYLLRVVFRGAGSSLWIYGLPGGKTFAAADLPIGVGALAGLFEVGPGGLSSGPMFNLYCEGESRVEVRAIQLYRAR